MNYSQFLKWALSHLSVIPVLYSLIQTIVTGTIEEKAAALKAIIDTLLPVIGDFPTVSIAGTETEAELESNVVNALASLPTAQGVETAAWDGARLRKIWDVVGPLLPILVSLLK